MPRPLPLPDGEGRPTSSAPPHGPPVDFPDGVHVTGLGRTGLAIALLLASRGMGPLALWDPTPVGASDLGTGYRPADLGRPRAVAAERRIRELHPRERVFAHHGPEAVFMGTATVSVTRGRIDESLVARALAAEHPLLPVVVDEESAVGPWTIAGSPGCALCEHVRRPAEEAATGRSRDAAWEDGPGEEDPESVLGALRTAVLVHDLLVAGSSSPAWQGVVRSWAYALDETTEGVRPRHGCPCDPDGMAADLAALTRELSEELHQEFGVLPGFGGPPDLGEPSSGA
ncbi:ThiF family adenylyltransferase [Micrococcus sp. EYE_162]|uniref:ThiF family adenylyltransferase n=1 Tax=unclassified Micrococcus TaxID=2620948 RepID=UPI002006BE46|nr:MULTISPECIES: ThiF family adenylyltransferase [unclassified Micrococcus]MCK6095786.1 ThiF family adenylyltransferase [Micrococcus sp. EYE_212]MCK6172401.1 ThiF family adenylyltransferase [Micrococcus sp. EYE_162]